MEGVNCPKGHKLGVLPGNFFRNKFAEEQGNEGGHGSDDQSGCPVADRKRLNQGFSIDKYGKRYHKKAKRFKDELLCG